MSLEKLKKVIKDNDGSYNTIRIRNAYDLISVAILLDEFDYISATSDIYQRYEDYVRGHDFQCVCVYHGDTYDTHNHDCGTECLFDFTKGDVKWV